MARQPTGRKKGRPFVYGSDDERPVSIALRIPRALADQLHHYAYEQRQTVTALLLDGLRWRLSQDGTTLAVPASAGRPATDAPPRGYYWGEPCKARGHVSHGHAPSGEPQNLRNWRGQCMQCEEEATDGAAGHKGQTARHDAQHKAAMAQAREAQCPRLF